MTTSHECCPLCGAAGYELITRPLAFTFDGIILESDARFWKCHECENELALEEEAKFNLRSANAAKAAYLGVPAVKEIRNWRKRWGLSQRDASKMLGTGEVSFSKYENNALVPSQPTIELLWLLINDNGATFALARKHGVQVIEHFSNAHYLLNEQWVAAPKKPLSSAVLGILTNDYVVGKSMDVSQLISAGHLFSHNRPENFLAESTATSRAQPKFKAKTARTTNSFYIKGAGNA